LEIRTWCGWHYVVGREEVSRSAYMDADVAKIKDPCWKYQLQTNGKEFWWEEVRVGRWCLAENPVPDVEAVDENEMDRLERLVEDVCGDVDGEVLYPCLMDGCGLDLGAYASLIPLFLGLHQRTGLEEARQR